MPKLQWYAATSLAQWIVPFSSVPFLADCCQKSGISPAAANRRGSSMRSWRSSAVTAAKSAIVSATAKKSDATGSGAATAGKASPSELRLCDILTGIQIG